MTVISASVRFSETLTRVFGMQFMHSVRDFLTLRGGLSDDLRVPLLVSGGDQIHIRLNFVVECEDINLLCRVAAIGCSFKERSRYGNRYGKRRIGQEKRN